MPEYQIIEQRELNLAATAADIHTKAAALEKAQQLANENGRVYVVVRVAAIVTPQEER